MLIISYERLTCLRPLYYKTTQTKHFLSFYIQAKQSGQSSERRRSAFFRVIYRQPSESIATQLGDNFFINTAVPVIFYLSLLEISNFLFHYHKNLLYGICDLRRGFTFRLRRRRHPSATTTGNGESRYSRGALRFHLPHSRRSVYTGARPLFNHLARDFHSAILLTFYIARLFDYLIWLVRVKSA